MYKDPQKQSEADKRWRLKHLDYWKRNIPRRSTKEEKLKNAIRMKSKRLYPVRSECEILECSVLAERHHPSYEYPEKIEWLCRKHHILKHKQMKQLKN